MEKRIKLISLALVSLTLLSAYGVVTSMNASPSKAPPLWHVATIDGGAFYGMYTSLAFDKSGTPHISYEDATNKVLKFASLDRSPVNRRPRP